MNVQRLCPVYKKWLQLNPSNARQYRYAMQAQTQQAHQQGRLDYARELGYQTFEAAKVILNALQPTSSQKVSVVQEDVLAFSTMGMYLSSLLAEEHRKRESHAILQECQQQLIAILPLHATNPSICRLIAAIQHTLEQSYVPQASKQLASFAVH
ncbi:hypothetical protein NO989_05415 [Alteromonas sp. DY56-G5]|uniref:hypothetical protein n=1 Tax=Alteromonas TaxID=226 RepID=UPI001280A31B|nr:hypothetical protein [Alteromonas macleodii]MDM7962728.1 hypothetical protein [Alteromonas macleodii]MDM8169037.1 hypothetical protein [Alteromonas macleodii]CAI3970093.1 hypothetical protein EZ55_04088 [Alteromonas macleodii]VTP57997.1 hypothetical protein EZ55_04088 [Alteromonas macleodii]